MSLNLVHQYTIVNDADKRAKIERVVNEFIKPRFVYVRSANAPEMESWEDGVYESRYVHENISDLNTVRIKPIAGSDVLVEVKYNRTGTTCCQQTVTYQWMVMVDHTITCRGLQGCVKWHYPYNRLSLVNYFPTPEALECLRFRNLDVAERIEVWE